MAFAVDASSPARVTGATTNGTVSVTTGSFNPPAAVLVATVQANARASGGGDGTANGAVSNNGTALTWTLVQERGLIDASGNPGYAGIFTAVLPSSRTGMTVTATLTSGSGAPNDINTPSIKVYVVTGADTATVVGGSAEGSSTTNNLTTTGFTSTGASSLGFAAGTDWNDLGAPASADCTVDAFGPTGAVSGVSGYKTLGAAGSSATFNLDAGGTGAASWNWVSAEILAATDAGGNVSVQPTYVADRGTTANATAATTTSVSLTSPTAIAVGNYLLARVAVDNSGTSGAAPGCTVTDSRNTWTVLGPALADPGAASAGATAYLCYAKVSTAYQAADTLTFNWGGISTTAKAIVVEEWTNIHPTSPVAVNAVTNNSVTAGSTTAVSVGITPTGPNQLVYTCLATEGIAGDTVGADSDTTNGAWVTLTTTASANATATNNQRVSGQYKVVTDGGAQSWDSTITSRDWAALAVVFAPPPLPPRVAVYGQGAALIRASYW